MKKKYFILLVAILLFLGGCGENEPKCLCGDDVGLARLDYVKNVTGVVEFHPGLPSLKVMAFYNEEGKKIDFAVGLPNCYNDSINSIGREFKISGFYLEVPREAFFLSAPFCYTELEIINSNEPK